MFNYSTENKIDLNVSVKYIGLSHPSISCSPSLVTISQCPEYLNKVLITHISESSISVTLLITLSVSPSPLSTACHSLIQPCCTEIKFYNITKNPSAISVFFKCTNSFLNNAWPHSIFSPFNKSY